MDRGVTIAAFFLLALTARLAAAPTGDGFAADSAVQGSLRGAFAGEAGATPLEIAYHPVVLDSATRTKIASDTKSPFPDDTLRVYACLRNGSIAGYGVVDNVKGKSREITYLVALTPGGEVADVDILVYRESHGGEVASATFTDQFRGKKPGERLVAGRDVRTISGATISSRSLTAGVARVLAAFATVKAKL